MSSYEHKLFLGYDVNQKALSTIVRESLEGFKKRSGSRVFACVNPHSLVVAETSGEFSEALKGADYLVSDGVGMKLGEKLSGVPVGPRIAGHDYFSAVLEGASHESILPEGRKARVFFFGSSEKVLSLIQEKFERDHPELELCGKISPPFGAWTEQQNCRMLEQINEADPDILWVGMTAPKQELWVHKNRLKINAPVIGSIGAVFDFYAGTYKRAPGWASRAGLEWLFRLVKEPRRMWRRNFISTPMFVWLVVKRYWLGL